VGAGFSGVLTAVRLLRAPDGPRVLLIERGARFGRGAAYATASPHHLLNVRGANMSALPEAPNHFLDWLGDSDADGELTFVTRDRYGQYLQALLRDAARQGSGRLVFEHDEASGLIRQEGGWRIEMAMGRTLRADAVVLAIGNLPPPTPRGVDTSLAESGRFIGEPWSWIEANRAVQGDVLVLGSGLTAVDVALWVQDQRPGSAILALSRHGLLPRPHARAERSRPAPTGLAHTPLDLAAWVRRAGPHDWRSAVDALRPHVQDIWRDWSLTQRRQFLRHLRPWWEVSRHRLAPQVDARLQDLRREGLFEVEAGRLLRLEPERDGVEALWTPRGGGPERRRRFAVAVNCTGPLSEVGRSTDPLVRGLLASGLARADDCGLGLDVDALSRPLGDDGQPSAGLFAVGPLTRGAVYEMTSVPDIRIQAAQVAGEALAHLARTAVEREAAHPSSEAALAFDLATHLEERLSELAMEIEGKSWSRRLRDAWELRGQRSALEDLVQWLDARGPR
jgi:uncharacterized NAD(P)/FAD-binding protein YdhS